MPPQQASLLVRLQSELNKYHFIVLRFQTTSLLTREHPCDLLNTCLVTNFKTKMPQLGHVSRLWAHHLGHNAFPLLTLHEGPEKLNLFS